MCLGAGALWSYLYEGLAVSTVRFECEIQEVLDARSQRPALLIDGATQAFNLVVGCDGGKSRLRQYVHAV